MKLGHLKLYNKKNVFLQKLCGKLERDNSSRPLLVFFEKALNEVKASVSIYFDST